MKCKRYDTNTLFYNRFLCKGVHYNSLASIFRNSNFNFIKTQLDALQANAEAGLPLQHPARAYANTVKFDEFQDACVLFSHLKTLNSEYTLRAEGFTLGIYTNDMIWLEELEKKIGLVELHIPPSETTIDYLLENPNVKIVDTPVEWKYKCFLGQKCNPSFSTFCETNSNKIKIGSTALEGVKRGWTDGFYFWTNDKRYLSLCMMAGATIKRVVKHVTRNEIR